MPFNIGPLELGIVLAIAFTVFGAGKLPGVGKAIGQSIREFKHAVTPEVAGKEETAAETKVEEN